MSKQYERVGKWVWQGCVHTPVTACKECNFWTLSYFSMINIGIYGMINITFNLYFPSFSYTLIKFISIWFSKQTHGQFHTKEIFIYLNQHFFKLSLKFTFQSELKCEFFATEISRIFNRNEKNSYL